MSEVLNWIKENWLIVVAALAWIISIVVTCINKKVKTVGDVLTIVYQKLPTLVSIAEAKFGAGSGAAKKEFVLESSFALIEQFSSLKREEIEKRYGTVIANAIEDILTTPVKKEA